jgi:hypothetical protein
LLATIQMSNDDISHGLVLVFFTMDVQKIRVLLFSLCWLGLILLFSPWMYKKCGYSYSHFVGYQIMYLTFRAREMIFCFLFNSVQEVSPQPKFLWFW